MISVTFTIQNMQSLSEKKGTQRGRSLGATKIQHTKTGSIMSDSVIITRTRTKTAQLILQEKWTTNYRAQIIFIPCKLLTSP